MKIKAWEHLKTISTHKYLVMQGCFRVGLYKQGLLHDLSKFTPTEFFVGAKYYQGTRSPNNAEREDIGYSSAWLHHKGRNKHHYEYWIDYSAADIKGGMAPAPMPTKYIVEMMMDRIAACKVYKGEQYTQHSAMEYYNLGRGKAPLHEKTQAMLEFFLELLDKYGEEKIDLFIKYYVVPRCKKWDKNWEQYIKHYREKCHLPERDA